MTPLATIITEAAPWMIKTVQQGEIKSPPRTASDRHYDAELAIATLTRLAEDMGEILDGIVGHYAEMLPDVFSIDDRKAIRRCISDVVADDAIGPLRVAVADYREQMDEQDDSDRRMEFVREAAE